MLDSQTARGNCSGKWQGLRLNYLNRDEGF